MKLFKWLIGNDDYQVELFTDSIGLWRHRIRAANGQIVATSGESYSSKAAALQTAKHLARSAGWPLVEI